MPTVAEVLTDKPVAESMQCWYSAQSDQIMALADDFVRKMEMEELLVMVLPPHGVLFNPRAMRRLPDEILKLCGSLAAWTLTESFSRLSQRAQDSAGE